MITEGFKGITKEQEVDQGWKKVAQIMNKELKSKAKRRKTIIVIEPPDSSKGTLSVNPSARCDMSHVEGSINNEQIRDNNPSVAQFDNKEDLDDEEELTKIETPRRPSEKEQKRQSLTEALEDIQVELNIDTGFETTV